MAFAILLPLLCLVTAVAYVVEPHLGVLNQGAANGAVLRVPPPPLAYKVLLLATIAVPLPFVIVALFGGAVSLSRARGARSWCSRSCSSRPPR